MKKIVALVSMMLLVAAFAVAQTHVGNTAYIPTQDILGAHNNGGRGCAGCHAPHSGGRGSGGVIAGSPWSTVTSVVNGTPVYGNVTPTATAAGTALGDVGLWGTDPGPLQTGMPILYQSTGSWSGYTVLSGTGTQINRGNDIFTGIVTCLSCHDGNVSRGAMMSGQSYEQFFGSLPTGSLSYNGTPVQLYNQNASSAGYQKIPTLLGNDGGTLGDYNNDHPVGPMATIGAAGGCGSGFYNGSYQQYTCAGDGIGSGGTGLNLTPGSGGEAPPNYVASAVTGSTYAYFLQNYGGPALKDLSQPSVALYGSGGTTNNYAWVTCKTCHDQHSMVVYAAGAGTASYQGAPIQGATTGQYATYFFVNGPYNPGAPFTPQYAPSTMQFCRQCHFEFSNESYKLNTVGTAF
jgi:hypothetical protein